MHKYIDYEIHSKYQQASDFAFSKCLLYLLKKYFKASLFYFSTLWPSIKLLGKYYPFIKILKLFLLLFS